MDAKTIRKRIKDELGLNCRKVSVRGRPCTYSWAIDVVIKVPTAKSPIEAIAKGAESIDRCEYSGEILSGGNTYVSVDYAEGVLDGFFDEAAIAALEENPGKTLELPGGFEVFYLDHYFHVKRGNTISYDHPERAYGARGAGRLYAERLLEDQAAAAKLKEAS